MLPCALLGFCACALCIDRLAVVVQEYVQRLIIIACTIIEDVKLDALVVAAESLALRQTECMIVVFVIRLRFYADDMVRTIRWIGNQVSSAGRVVHAVHIVLLALRNIFKVVDDEVTIAVSLVLLVKSCGEDLCRFVHLEVA